VKLHGNHNGSNRARVDTEPLGCRCTHAQNYNNNTLAHDTTTSAYVLDFEGSEKSKHRFSKDVYFFYDQLFPNGNLNEKIVYI